MLYAAPLIFGLSLGLLSSKTKSICLQHCHFMYFSTSSSSALIPTLTSAHTNTHTHTGLCLIQLHLGQPVWTESNTPLSLRQTQTASHSFFHPSISPSSWRTLLLNHPLHLVVTMLSSRPSLPPFRWHSAIISVHAPVAVTLLPFLAPQPCSS